MSRIVAQDVVDQTVIDTLTETNVFVGTIPSGEWPGRVVVLEQTGRYQNSGAAQNYTVRLYIGSTAGAGGTLATQFTSPSAANSALGQAAWQRWVLMGLDSDSLRVTNRWGIGGLGSDGGLFVIPTSPGTYLTNRMEGLSLSGAVEIRITVQLNSVVGTTHQFASRGVWAGLVTPAVAASSGTTVSVITAGF